MIFFKTLFIFAAGFFVGVFFLVLIQEGNKKKYEIKRKWNKGTFK